MAEKKSAFTKTAPVVTPATAIEFGQVNAQRKELEKIEKKLSEKIKGGIKTAEVEIDHKEGTNGTIVTYTFNPIESPYALVYSESSIVDVKWAEEFQQLYTKLYGLEAYNKFVMNLPLKDSTKLEAKPNPYYVKQ